MRQLLLAVLAATLLVIAPSAAGAQTSCWDDVQQMVLVNARPDSRAVERPGRDLRAEATAIIAALPSIIDPAQRAHKTCIAAELLKRLGDPKAESMFRAALAIEPDNAEFHLLLGDYYRLNRGPEQPLFGPAAHEYYEGLNSKTADTAAKNEIRRSLIALYEADGLPLLGNLDQRPPVAFFSTQNTAGQVLNAFGRDDDLRVLTSAALFAESTIRLDAPLTLPQLNYLIRNDWHWQTLERLRVRWGSFAVDDSLSSAEAIGSQVTNYFQPQSAGNVTVFQNDLGIEDAFDLYPLCDLLVRGDVAWGSQTGLIEFQPRGVETTRSVTGRLVASRFVNSDKLNVELSGTSEAISQHVSTPIARGSDSFGVTVRYQFYRQGPGGAPYERPIAPRGSELFVGKSNANDTYGGVMIPEHDVFFGGALKGLPGGGAHTWDLTVQPTFFSDNQTGFSGPGVLAEPLPNGQVETFVTILYRVVDHENERNVEALPALVFLNVVGVASVGKARYGLNAFDRTRMGAEVDAKLAGRQRGLSWLASARFEVDRFPQLGRVTPLFLVSLNMGF